MRQNPLQLAAGRAGSCRADSTCRHQSEKGLVILAHCPFGPRGSTVSGRHLHATYGDFATTFASASFSFVCRACSCSHAWRVATAPRGVHSARLGPQPHHVASHVCSHNTHAHSSEADVARVSRQQSVASEMEEHTSELQSHLNLVCRLLLEKKKERIRNN